MCTFEGEPPAEHTSLIPSVTAAAAVIGFPHGTQQTFIALLFSISSGQASKATWAEQQSVQQRGSSPSNHHMAA